MGRKKRKKRDKKVKIRKNIIFGFLGRLHKSKGLIPLMEAFKNYWSLYPKENVILKIAGDGDLKDQIIDLSNKNINCEYLGEIKYDEVDNFIKTLNNLNKNI